MSVFSNPRSGAAREAAAYISAVLAMLGSLDPVTVLRETASEIRRLTADLTGEVLRRPEKERKWSAVEILQHLADSELVWAYRLRLVIAEERPPLPGFDQDAWASRLRYRDADPAEAQHVFELLRRLNLQQLERLPPREMERVGLHSERGEESLAHMVRLYAGHDLVHLRQLKRVLAAAGAPRN